MAYICGKSRIYVGNGLSIWKRLKYVGNDVDLPKMAEIYVKWLKYLRNALNMWEMTQRFWEMTRIFMK